MYSINPFLNPICASPRGAVARAKRAILSRFPRPLFFGGQLEKMEAFAE